MLKVLAKIHEVFDKQTSYRRLSRRFDQLIKKGSESLRPIQGYRLEIFLEAAGKPCDAFDEIVTEIQIPRAKVRVRGALRH